MFEILGVKIDSLTMSQAVAKARDFLFNGKSNLIFTPNPEMLVDAQTDRYFREVLNVGDLNLSDGFGVSFVSLGKIKRVTGVDFVYHLCELAQVENKSIYLAGSGSREVLKKTVENLKQKFPKLKIVGYHPGPKISFLMVDDKKTIVPEPEDNEQMMHEIIMTAPDILLVAFGHNKQEKWIYENIKSLPSVKVAVGVGGSFDFIAGFNSQGQAIRRAPCFMRKIGLEWLYRLFLQPWRLARVWKATAVFVSLYFYKKLRNKVL